MNSVSFEEAAHKLISMGFGESEHEEEVYIF